MSDRPKKIPVWLKLAVVVVILVGIGEGTSIYLRPVAKVETVISGEAEDAKPGSVAVKEEYTMQMKSQIGGRVLNKDYKLEIGMHVKEGDVLVNLDPADVLIEIDEAQNQYDSSKRLMDLGSAATFTLETAQSDFTNTERLFKMGQISDSDYQKARRAVETIKQQLALENVHNQEGLVTDQNTLRSKKLELERMTVRAPFDGIVSAVFAHPGDLIDIGSPIVALITTTRVVEAKISEEDFANIKVGEVATIHFITYGAWVYNGTVKRILPTADPETQRHLVDLTVTDIEPEKLIPGLTGEVTIVVGSRHANAIIPRRALFNDNVYVVKDGRVELRHVTHGYLWLTGAEILTGLEPGDQVIVEDLESFRDGDKVKVEELPSDAFVKRN